MGGGRKGGGESPSRASRPVLEPQKSEKFEGPRGQDQGRRPSFGAAGRIESCLPSPAKAPPSGPDWLHEIKPTD
jgi:hypothetical protein